MEGIGRLWFSGKQRTRARKLQARGYLVLAALQSE
jgi:hypothetical protein